jgi:voltage-dependent calcium channel
MTMLDVVVRFYGLGWYSFRNNGWNIYDAIVGAGSLVTTLLVRISPTQSLSTTLQKLFIVAIAFKLVQRADSLNKLFKTAVYVRRNIQTPCHLFVHRSSLPVILSLVALWFILFLFFAGMFVEVFSLTKWGSGENQLQNYATMGSALVMLAFMSTGYVTVLYLAFLVRFSRDI